MKNLQVDSNTLGVVILLVFFVEGIHTTNYGTMYHLLYITILGPKTIYYNTLRKLSLIVLE